MLIIFSYIYDLQIMFTIEPRPSPKCAMTVEAGGRNVNRNQQPCCMEDGGRPSGGGLQDQPSNHPALRALCANMSETSSPSTITVGRGKKSHFDKHRQDEYFFRCVGSFGA